MRHGTVYEYTKGCHCSACRAAKAESNRTQRAKARAENRPSYQRELAANRDRKEGYRGTCKNCGGPTSWAGGHGQPELCITCSREQRAAQHGTTSKYNSGCHCDLCAEANRKRSRDYYATRKAKAAS